MNIRAKTTAVGKALRWLLIVRDHAMKRATTMPIEAKPNTFQAKRDTPSGLAIHTIADMSVSVIKPNNNSSQLKSFEGDRLGSCLTLAHDELVGEFFI